jgi:hypothetical protein
MDDRIRNLLQIVSQEIALYRDLTEHARHKSALLAKGQAEAIRESKRIEEVFNNRLRNLENEMAHLAHDLCRIFRIPREEFTLTRLADTLEHSLALEIRYRTALFLNIVRQLKSVTQRNMKLVEKSFLRTLQGSLPKESRG